MDISLKSFARNSSIYALGNIINRLGALILLPVYTNFLTPEQYGILELFYSTSSILMSVLSVGLAHSVLRFYYEYDDPKSKKLVISTALISSLVITSCGVLLLVPWNGPMSRLLFDSTRYSNLFYLIYFSFILDMSIEIESAYLRAKEYAARFVAISIARFLGQVALNIFFVLCLHRGITGVLLGNTISTVCAWAYLTAMTLKENSFKFSVRIFSDLFKYSYPFLLSSISSVVLANADRYILKSASSLAAVGIYSLAQKFGRLPTELFSTPFYSSFGPFRFSIMRRADVGEILSRLMVLFFAGISFMSLGLVLFTPDILRIMSSPGFRPAAPVVPYLAFVGVLGGLSYFFQTGIMYSKKTTWLFYISTASAALSIVFNLLLIPRFDIYGASVSRILSMALMVVCTFFVAQKIMHIRYRMAKAMTTVAAAGALFTVFLLLPEMPLSVSIAVKFLLLLAYVPLLFLARCFDAKDLDEIRIWTARKLNRGRAIGASPQTAPGALRDRR